MNTLSTTPPNSGATPEPPQAVGLCMGVTRKHVGEWVWVNRVWTNQERCKNCGETWTPEALKGKTP